MSDSIFSAITLRPPYPSRQYPPLPTRQALLQFEEATGLKLPESFADFACQFGTGELADHFRIYADPADLASFNQKLHSANWLASVQPSEVAGRLFFFGATIGGLSYAWDTGDLRDARQNEYAIYEVHHDLKRIGDSFGEFVVEYCLRRYREGDDEAEVEPCFVRYAAGKGTN